MTVQTLGSSIQAQNSNWNIWTNITWPQQESQVMGAGVLGLGLATNTSSGSVWSYGSGLCDPSNPNFGVVQLQYYRLAEWGWADVPLQRPFENNVTLCASTNSANYLTTFNSTSFGPQSTYFAFGQINSTEDIFMQNLVGANSTASVTISTQEVGLGLSPDLFRKFVNLVSIASEGTLSCPGSDLGLPCIIPFGCDQLPASMFFSFCVDDCSATGKNITVPLATFASPVNDYCELWVNEREYLWNGVEILGSQVIIGNLFHQSFAAQFNTLTGAYYLTPSAAVSDTEFMGYFGQLFQTAQNNGNNPFVVRSVQLTQYTTTF